LDTNGTSSRLIPVGGYTSRLDTSRLDTNRNSNKRRLETSEGPENSRLGTRQKGVIVMYQQAENKRKEQDE
jgi:hypothetical protein